MVHLDAQRGLEQFAIEVLRGSRAGRAEGEAARGGARKLTLVASVELVATMSV